MTKTAEAELDEKIRSLMRASGRTYSEAMSVVLTMDGELKRRWIAESLKRRPVRQ